MKLARIFVVIFGIFTISGCATPMAQTSQQTNRENMLRLNIGMTKGEVISIMGTTYRGDLGTVQSNPYKRETVPSRDGRLYDVFYYWTDGSGRPTPLAFNNERLAGIGWAFIEQYGLRVQEQEEARAQGREQSNAMINFGLETLRRNQQQRQPSGKFCAVDNFGNQSSCFPTLDMCRSWTASLISSTCVIR